MRRHIKRLVIGVVLVAMVLPSVVVAHGGHDHDEALEGQVIDVQNEEEVQMVKVEIVKGSIEGESVEVINDSAAVINAPKYQVGDQVVVIRVEGVDGQNIFYISDYVRRDGLIYLFALFVFLAILVGGIWGATSLLGMVFSFFIIFKFILPQILLGKDAILIAIVGSAMIIPVTFSLSHGFKTKTFIAGVGTVFALIITGIVATIAVNLARLSGFGSEEAGFLQSQFGNLLNIKGLLLAGMIISSLGVLDDITISQASVVAELKDANKKYKFADLFKRSMNVGRDHIASLINTLVLVYAGASLPLLLLFVNNPLPFESIVNHEMIAEEIVRTLVGSIGLILAVPITSLLASYYYKNN